MKREGLATAWVVVFWGDACSRLFHADSGSQDVARDLQRANEPAPAGPRRLSARFGEKELAAGTGARESAGRVVRGVSVMGMVRVFRGRASPATAAGSVSAARPALPCR